MEKRFSIGDRVISPNGNLGIVIGHDSKSPSLVKIKLDNGRTVTGLSQRVTMAPKSYFMPELSQIDLATLHGEMSRLLQLAWRACDRIDARRGKWDDIDQMADEFYDLSMEMYAEYRRLVNA